jgi:hypothetical protein
MEQRLRNAEEWILVAAQPRSENNGRKTVVRCLLGCLPSRHSADHRRAVNGGAFRDFSVKRSSLISLSADPNAPVWNRALKSNLKQKTGVVPRSFSRLLLAGRPPPGSDVFANRRS